MYKDKVISFDKKNTTSIDLAKISNGIYQMDLLNKNTKYKKIFLIQK